MKLNLSESNLSHGLTPLITTPTQTAKPSPTAPSHLSIGTQTDTPPSSSCRLSPLYLLALTIMLFLPFVLPVAITHVVRIVDSAPLSDLHIGRASRRIAPNDWSHWAVVRNGRLYVSETFENRLNEYSDVLYPRVAARFGRECANGDVGFGLNRGQGIRGWVEVTMKCGYGSCVRRARVDDVRKLIVTVEEGKHYVSGGGSVWGPLRGPLRVGLDGDAVLHMRRLCQGVVDQLTLTVEEVRRLVGEEIDVFRLDADPGMRVTDRP